MNISKPNRKKHCYAQHLHAEPKRVFTLLCPVLEAEWVPGWMPEMVISQSGVCEQECVFITPTETPDESKNSIWIVTKYDAENLVLKMYKVTPKHTLSKLEISLARKLDGSTTANISYEITSLGAEGEKFLEEFTAEWYEAFMLEWEKQMNHYLETGTKLV